MGRVLRVPVRPSRRGEPAWELLDVLPPQGEWTEDDYLRLRTNRQVEFTDGVVEVLPMPDWVHQTIVSLLLLSLQTVEVGGRRGRAVQAPFKLKLRARKWREPDVLYLLPANAHRLKREWWDYADLVVEVVSHRGGGVRRDYVRKRRAYARAGIPEYWIVDAERQVIVVLTLDGTTYREAGRFTAGQRATSIVVPGFDADVGDLVRQATEALPPG